MRSGTGSPRPLRPQDAFFRYVETPRVRQQIGAVIVLGAGSAGNPDVRLEAVGPALCTRLARLPLLRRTMVPRGWWRRPAWRFELDVVLTDHVGERFFDSGSEEGAGAKLISDFFAAPLAMDRPPWEMRLLHDSAGGPSVILAKTHHALGDGAAVLGTMIALLADEDLTRMDTPGTARRKPGSGWQRRLRRYRKIASGFRALASSGTAPRLPGGYGTPRDERQSYEWFQLPTATVQARARVHRVDVGTFLLAVVAEALHRALADRAGHRTPPGELRALVPKTTRSGLPSSGGSRAPGNWSAAVAMDLPLGEMAPATRLAAIAHRGKELDRGGEPEASQLAMAVFGMLPAPLHAAVLRLLYGHRIFNLIVTVLPGPTLHPHLAGIPAEAVYPLLPLAPGVGLGICTLRWADLTGVGITTDPALLGGAEEMAAHVHAAFAAFGETEAR